MFFNLFVFLVLEMAEKMVCAVRRRRTDLFAGRTRECFYTYIHISRTSYIGRKNVASPSSVFIYNNGYHMRSL